MDLLNTISLPSDYSFGSTNQNKGLFEPTEASFSSIIANIMSVLDNDLVENLLNEFADLNDDEIPDYATGVKQKDKDYTDVFNFKDLVVTPEGIRGLTDAYWTWGVAFTYSRKDGNLHIDTRSNSPLSGVVILTDKSKCKFESLIAELIQGNSSKGLLIFLEGEYVL